MKKIDVRYLRPDMTLAKTIYNKDGMVLLYEGVRLTGSYINSLKNLGIKKVFVHKEEKKEYDFPEIMSTHIQKKVYREIWSYMTAITNRRLVKTKKIKNKIEKIITKIIRDPLILLHMMDLFFFDDYTLNHSLHVCFLSILLGTELKLKEEELLHLGKGAFLHDIGKMKIPLEIINKPGKLTGQEWSIIKKHSTIGYEMIKEYHSLSKEASSILLYHHERSDGDGYPQHLRKNEIHLYCRIVAIADVFDAISSDRPHRKGKDYFTTIGILKSKSHFSKDPLLPLFLKHIAAYEKGTEVRLSNNCTGTVVAIYKEDPKSPDVKILKDHRGEPVKVQTILSLREEQKISIIEILDFD